MFFITKMYEAGILSSDQAAQTVGVSQPQFIESARGYLPNPTIPESETHKVETDDTESWFTPEQIAQFKENRRRLDKEYEKNPPPLTHEEFQQVLLNGPVADEEESRTLEEIQDMSQCPHPGYLKV